MASYTRSTGCSEKKPADQVPRIACEAAALRIAFYVSNREA
jgi:hypothetical protein